jgi:hypothetical protein
MNRKIITSKHSLSNSNLLRLNNLLPKPGHTPKFQPIPTKRIPARTLNLAMRQPATQMHKSIDNEEDD